MEKEKLKLLLEEILESRERKNEKEEKKFLSLVDQISGYVDINVARALMKTFLARPDYGTQERVIRAMLSGGREIYIQSILEELPRLQREARNWIEILLCPEIEHHPKLLEKIAQAMPTNIKTILKEILNDEEIRQDYPNAIKIAI